MVYAPDWNYIPGDPHAVCDRCCEKRRRSVMRKEWTNLVCCPDCWDPPIPQLFAPNVWPEGLPIPDARPEPPNIFVEPGDVTPEDL